VTSYREEDGDKDVEEEQLEQIIDVEMTDLTATSYPEDQLLSPADQFRALIDLKQTGDHTPLAVKTEESEPALSAAQAQPPSDSIDVDALIEDPPAPPLTDDTFLAGEDDDEEKPKPVLKLRYEGFSIRGRCLCVIVEPYPPLRRPPHAISLAPTGLVAPRAPSIAPPEFDVGGQRARTPLFLPEDDRERSATPAPWGTQPQHKRPPVPLWGEDVEADADEVEEVDGGMLAFSQILKSVGDYATGAAEDDDEIEGAVFLGDADEARDM
jgi:hypothetical protein